MAIQQVLLQATVSAMLSVVYKVFRKAIMIAQVYLYKILKCHTLTKCALNMAVYGCRYSKEVEDKLRVLEGHREPICVEVVKRLNSKHKWIRDSRINDRKRTHTNNKYGKSRHGKRNKKRNRQSNSNQMGRMEFKRRRTSSRPREVQSRPKRQTNGTSKLTYIPYSWPTNVVPK